MPISVMMALPPSVLPRRVRTSGSVSLSLRYHIGLNIAGKRCTPEDEQAESASTDRDQEA